MAPWQVYEASRKRCSKEDAPVTLDAALRARLAPHLEYPRFVGKLEPDKLPANVSRELDSNYRAILDEGDEGRRVVREAVLAESVLKPPNSFFLLDMGHFLVGDSYVLDSDLPRAELTEWLRATRAAQLRRQSDEALSDLKITNALVSALSLRER
jgi:hypothetical protein